MSSFTIAKVEYIKAAGLVSGLAETLGGRIDRIWIYDYETHRNSTAEDYYRKFDGFYKMNALSVLEQYHGDEVGAASTDSNDYMKEFKEYQKIGKSIGYTREKLKEAILELQHFFNSAVYQTENEAYATNMRYFFNMILTELIPYVLTGYEAKSWGEFIAPKPEHTVEPLF